MKTIVTSAIVAFAFASTAAFAQAPAPSAPATGSTAPAAKPAAPAATTPAPATSAAKPAMLEPAVEAKFKAVDKDNNGTLDGGEVATFKNDMGKIDTDKDGKISRAEFAAAMKGGVIK